MEKTKAYKLEATILQSCQKTSDQDYFKNQK